MKTPPKPLLIAGAVALAAGGIYLVKKKEQANTEETFTPVQAPATYYGSQEAAGSFWQGGGGAGGNFAGGGPPSSEVPGVVTTPKSEWEKRMRDQWQCRDQSGRIVPCSGSGNEKWKKDDPNKPAPGYQNERYIFEKLGQPKAKNWIAFPQHPVVKA